MREPDPFHENADLLHGFEERSLTGKVKVPSRVLQELEETRKSTLHTRQYKKHWAFSLRHSVVLRAAAVIALLAVVTWMVMPHPPATARVVITSPGDVINDTRPRIAWTSKDKPGQKYDVWILPAEGNHLTAPALFVAKGVTSPVRFEQFQPGLGLDTSLPSGVDYRVLVCLADAGRTAGVPVPFKVK